MAKKIRFPLKMNNVDIRTIEELQENFDIEAVLGYYTSGKLITWLRDRYYNEEADTIEALSADDEQFSIKLAKVLGVEIEDDEELDIEEVKLRREKLEMLSRYISDRTILDNVDIVAVDQDDLYDILDSDTDKVYLFKETFIVPVGRENITYIGINGAKVKLIGILNFDKYDIFRSYGDLESFSFEKRGIKFINIDFSEDNSTEFMYIIAQAYLDGDGVEKNIELFENWEKKILDRCKKAAENGNSEDQYRLGYCYDHYYDNGVLDDEERTSNKIEWYSKAANSGNTKAQFSLGWYHYLIKSNYDEAIHWFKECAMENVSEAMYYLGEIYWHHLEDEEEAIEWFRQAANVEGDSYEKGAACNYLGDFYKDKDYAQALMWYKKASELSNDQAQYNLGNCYYYGNGVKQNYEEAVKWYTLAATNYHVDAQCRLGDCYLYAKGVKQDFYEAEKWYKKCADEFNSEKAYIGLADCYSMKNSPIRDVTKALEWAEKAEKSGINFNNDSRTREIVSRIFWALNNG